MKSKQAELSTQQIVLIIILIASFIVILFFLFRLGIGEESEEQLCRNSVLQKASVFSEAPLQCYRDYVCITKDGSCEGLIKPEKIKVKSLDEVYGTLANEMADCWGIFGEGKVDYVGTDFTKNNYCSICSQIYFDDSLENLEGVKDKKISKDELYDYLTNNEYSKDQTYSQYLFGTNNFGALKQEALQEQGVGTFGKIEIEKQFFVVMVITNEVGTIPWVLTAAAGTVAGIVIALNPIGWVATGVTIVATSIVGSSVGAAYAEGVEPEIDAIVMEGNGISNNFMRPTIIEADSNKFEVLNCEDILTYA